MRGIQKRRVADLQIEPRIKEVLMKILGPEEEVYVETSGGRIRIII
ncbi:hypothetical protein [Pyrobaculum neutrophilum]|uniref:Uncharacterized protein n=1 Tax=Pyrobaculum neutrophilum (strain DSM 2338 / JCM 9278 / NBRC 100436 / V24Sta) TaxID=444157 RepID=B1YAX7_PYRNV|nr:hypothetical protein [Pyrobaculum neutrophilum]ACB40677.1 conserved hypothetical protein [Pyrobaculum neutrophilum V24Sta]